MTLKHTNFRGSAVMRELERQARKKGEFDDVVVKTAASKLKEKDDASAPSDNLYNNLYVLANKLRDKGYESHAKFIEDKIFIFKNADNVHLYRTHDEDGEDLLNDAYPDGDVEIAESKSHMGKFWTPQSQQKEIHKLVNKEPTGKLSNAADSIKAVAQSLFEEITQEESEEEPRGLDKGGIRAKNIEIVRNVFGKINATIKKLADNLDRRKLSLVIHFWDILGKDGNARELFLKYNDTIDSRGIAKIHNAFNFWYGQGTGKGTAPIINKLKTASENEIKEYASKVGVNASTYLHGVSGSWVGNKSVLVPSLVDVMTGTGVALGVKRVLNKIFDLGLPESGISDLSSGKALVQKAESLAREFPYNEKSIYLEVHKPGKNSRSIGNTKNVNELASKIKSALDTHLERLNKEVHKADKKIKSNFNEFVSELAGLPTNFDKSLISENVINFDAVSNRLSKLYTKLENILNSDSTSDLNIALRVLDPEGHKALKGFWKEALGVIDRAAKVVAERSKKRGEVLTSRIVKDLSRKLESIRSVWENRANRVEEGSSAQNRAITNHDKTLALKSTIEALEGKPLFSLNIQLKRYGIDTFDTLQDLRDFVDVSYEMIVEAGSSNRIVKQAQSSARERAEKFWGKGVKTPSPEPKKKQPTKRQPTKQPAQTSKKKEPEELEAKDVLTVLHDGTKVTERDLSSLENFFVLLNKGKDKFIMKASEFEEKLEEHIWRAYEKRRNPKTNEEAKIANKYISLTKDLMSDWSNLKSKIIGDADPSMIFLRLEHFIGRPSKYTKPEKEERAPKKEPVKREPSREGFEVSRDRRELNRRVKKALNNPPFPSRGEQQVVDVKRLAERFYTMHQGWFDKFTQHGVIDMRHLRRDHPSSLWQDYLRIDLHGEVDPGNFIKGFAHHSIKTISESFSQWLKLVRSIGIKNPNIKDRIDNLVIEQQRSARRWISVLEDLLRAADKWKRSEEYGYYIKR